MSRPPLTILLRRLAVLIRTEGGGPRRESAAIAVGVFIGCLPVYGFHLVLCTVLGTVLRLNRLKMYLAANISNPFVAPWLIFLELQVGAWLRRGSFHALTIDTVRAMSLASVSADLLVGGIATGAFAGALAGGLTYAMMRGANSSDAFTDLVRRASNRYIDAGILAWEFARGKLRGDPIYRAVVCGGLLPSPVRSAPADATRPPSGAGRTLVDVGCGTGLTLVLLDEARRAMAEGTWPEDWAAPPCFDRVVGLELRPRAAAIAAAALAGGGEVIVGDARTALPPHFHTVLLFDVLHMMTRRDQEALLAAIASALDPDGALLIREADASAGWPFTMVRLGNRLKALAFGAWRQQFHFRTVSEWQSCLARHGLHAEAREMSTGTPFANVLLFSQPRRSPRRASAEAPEAREPMQPPAPAR